MKIVFIFLILLMSVVAKRNRCRCCKKLAESLEAKLDDIKAFLEAPSSCQQLYAENPNLKSGVYDLKFEHKKIPVYCHMGDFGCGGGGWTLAMKIDGSKTTFSYESSLWSSKEPFNLTGGETGFDTQETKLPTYWSTPFSKICLGMETNDENRFFSINKQADSLHSLIADGTYQATSLGRQSWKGLLGSDASLQGNCNKEGFNAKCEYPGSNIVFARARIGILGNEDNDCKSCDSRIGFGTGGYPDNSNTCGNEALHGGDNGDKHIKAMGYILVQ